jgi:hypothetical protein
MNLIFLKLFQTEVDFAPHSFHGKTVSTTKILNISKLFIHWFFINVDNPVNFRYKLIMWKVILLRLAVKSLKFLL